jgi:hypothetical protein
MAARFWVTTGTTGGTGNWSDSQNWSTTSGGGAGASVPGSADTATFNASSGAGTATVDSNVTIQTLTMTGFTGTLAFGVNTISVNSTGTVYTGAATFAVTGTPVIIVTNATATATTVTAGAVTEANSISFKFTGGTYALTFLGTASHAARNVDFTGYSGTWLDRTNAYTIYGSLTISTGMNSGSAGSTGILTFGGTSGTQVFTSNTSTVRDIYFPITINGVGGTVQLADSLRIVNNLILTNGTFDANNVGIAITGSGTFSMTTGSVFVKGVTTTSTFTLAFTQTSGTLTQIGNNTFRAFTLTSGTLDLGSYKLTCETFASSNANVRTIAFGTGNITCTLSGTAWTTATTTNLTVTGTSNVNITYSGNLGVSVLPGILTESNTISFNFTAGTYDLTFLGTVNYSAKNVDFTGFAGTWLATSTGVIYGNLTLSTGMTLTASNSAMTFGATSGTQVITSNAKTMNFPITINGIGGAVQLADALLMGTTRTLTHTNGTLDLNGKTLTVGTAYTTATGTKNLTFNAGTLVCPAAATTAFNNAVPTGFTTTAGTSTGKISMTAATAKTFVGGDSTYNCILSNDGAGALTISGSNTFTTIANGVQPTAFTFTAATTQAVTNWTVSGTAGNLVTIISNTAGVPALLSKASGTVSSNYLSLKDSTALGGAAWYAGANSTNVSGNLGWIFSNAPSNAAGSFFFMF